MSPSPSTLTFISGQTVGAQRCTDVTVLDDNLIEDDEIFSLSLIASLTDENAVMFTAGENFTIITILQDPNDSKSIILCVTTGQLFQCNFEHRDSYVHHMTSTYYVIYPL